ncbi:DeoR/GlpR family DNA-binding transcription regulator [Actinotalea subterranea]|uniref:DeoR/GlpR family DNA-binding transcription regulator n=1 Tax=Actinotalea subterranea TaxID=2607497 RepID=UPI001FE948D2|nr:DeoR/GlpR family DNA-binding transcription regulator [Actinotalea subterranea]
MLKEEVEQLPVTLRRERMLQLIAERQFVRVADLADAFSISDVTVRTDLAALELSHAVRRVRGGVIAPVGGNRTEPTFEQAAVEFAREKQRIGEHAAAMVSSGMSVIIDVGTTTTAIARALAARTDLEQVVVITNGLNIALDLERAIGRLSVVVTGGTLRPLQHSLVNPMATLLLERVHADLAFIGCNGIDVEHGVTNVNLPEAEVKQRILTAAEHSVVVADGSKIGQVHLGRIARLDQVHRIVTGPSAPADELRHLRAAGAEVVQVE